MTAVERKKGINKGLILLLVLVVIILAASFPTIQSSYSKISIQKTKKETTVTKTLTKDEIYSIERDQRKLAEKYETENKWLYKEIRDAALMIDFNYDFMYDHPEYDSVKIKFPVTTYRVDGNTVEFFSKKGKIIQVIQKMAGKINKW